MPELPEVETIRIGLARLLPGKKISSIDFDWPRGFPNTPSDVEQFAVGAEIVKVARRAKVLLIELSSKYSLVIHLKMTGQLVYVDKQNSKIEDKKLKEAGSQNTAPPKTKNEVRFGAGHPNRSLVGKLPDKSTRVIIEFTDGSILFFNDQRKFGWMRLLPTAEIPNIDFFKKVGPEPLSSEFTAEAFHDRLQRRKNSSIKAAILDQTVLAGVGNIYADEGLWAAKIHPGSLVKKLSNLQTAELYKALVKVLKLSIKKGGSTDKNYVDAEGKSGSYLIFANVFRREGKTCPRCGTIIEKSRVAGRGTHTCPYCQKPS